MAQNMKILLKHKNTLTRVLKLDKDDYYNNKLNESAGSVRKIINDILNRSAKGQVALSCSIMK